MCLVLLCISHTCVVGSGHEQLLPSIQINSTMASTGASQIHWSRRVPSIHVRCLNLFTSRLNLVSITFYFIYLFFFSHLSSVKTERNSMACMSASFALVAQPLAQATGGMATLIWDLLFWCRLTDGLLTTVIARVRSDLLLWTMPSNFTAAIQSWTVSLNVSFLPFLPCTFHRLQDLSQAP